MFFRSQYLTKTVMYLLKVLARYHFIFNDVIRGLVFKTRYFEEQICKYLQENLTRPEIIRILTDSLTGFLRIPQR